jgi:EAL and modified HD-GYP domain-containing signal transduction protein
MFSRLLKLFTRKQKTLARPKQAVQSIPADDHAFTQLNELAPVLNYDDTQQSIPNHDADVIDANAVHSSVVYREAILNKSQKISGYSFTLSRKINLRMYVSTDEVQRLYYEVLLKNIISMNIQRLLGHRLAFIPIFPSTLNHPLLQALPAAGTVLVINNLTQLATENKTTLPQIQALKQAGFRIALQGNIHTPGMQPFLELAEYVFIDIGGNNLLAITSQINEITTHLFNKRLVATNVRTLDEFHVCANLPFHYIQGTFVTSRAAWTKPSMDAGRIKILELLNRIRQDAGNLELAQAIKLDPALSFKLLRYINSVGTGLTTKISAIDQALMVLGQQNIYRWLTMQLFISGTGSALDLALMENALVRARLAELCATDSLSIKERDELFVTGIFSLLDILLRIPMEQALAQISLPPLAIEALLHKTGKYAPYLELATACETFNQELIAEISNRLSIDITQVNTYHADALIWAYEVSN